MKEKILEVKNLEVSFKTYAGISHAVRGIDFNLHKGETLAIVGESGCGKTVSSKAIMRLLPESNTIIGENSEVLFHGEDLLKKSENEMVSIRGSKISMIFQDPMTSLNPTMKIGDQIAESILIHRQISKEEAYKENLEAIKVADVTDTNRLVMKWRGETIVDMSRAFLDTNGVRQHQIVDVCENEYDEHPFDAVNSDLNTVLQDANVASQIGLAEMFDASIGKSTVLMPFGGKYQLTPEEGSVQKLPVHGMTNTCSVMTYGYDPKVSKYSPYLGASYSVVEALARITALGADYKKCRLSNQEYFEHLGADAQKWGQPFEALLGLIDAQLAFETPSIGGKDSMSGTYKDIHVPPTVITFAVTTAKTDDIVSASFKNPGDYVYLVKHTPVKNNVPNYEQLKENFETVHKLMQEKKIVAASTIKFGGLGATIAKMAFGSKVGVAISTEEDVYGFNLGSMIVEATESIQDEHLELIGILNDDSKIVLNDETVEIEDALKAWTKRYSEIYPMIVDEGKDTLETPLNDAEVPMSKEVVEKPKVIIPIFPGQNCEFDTTAKFERAGAEVKQVVFNNLTVENIQKSIETLAKEISTAQILMIVGGFSSGDEPDGSGKFIANVLRNPKIAQAIDTMRANDGLILGICNGFQALIKSGLLPYGDIGCGKSNII
mgnify:CR=1 FL=1